MDLLRTRVHLYLLAVTVVFVYPAADPAYAGAVRDIAGFTTNTFHRNDDESLGVTLPFGVHFGDATYNSLYLNNNGNLTFTSPIWTYTPFSLSAQDQPIIAAFWADVDTRSGPGVTTYGTGVVNGHAAFGVDWLDVGYYNQRSDRLNSFQAILIDRSDTGAGNFDIEFNYDQITWETGDVSGGRGGLGGQSAVMGYSTTGATGGYVFQYPGSLRPGGFLDGGSNALIASNFGPEVPGRYLYTVRDGTTSIPGGSASTPLEPNNVNSVSDATTQVSFNNVPSGSWFNPPPAQSFLYMTTGESLFTEITVDPRTFTLTYGNTTVTVPEDSTYTFPGGGVSSFSISGGNVGPVFLRFDDPVGGFTVDATTTPEPGHGVRWRSSGGSVMGWDGWNGSVSN